MTQEIQRLEIHDTLNPKLLEPTESEDSYVNCQQQGYVTDGTQIEFWLPNDCVVDLSNSEFQLSVRATNTIPAIAEVFTYTAAAPFAGVNIATAGTFKLKIGDNITKALPFNATNLQIRTALFALKGLSNDIDLVEDPTLAIQPFSRFQILTNSLATGGNPASLSFSINYDSLKLKDRDIPVLFISSLLNGVGASLIFNDLSPVDDGDYLYPRFDGSGIGSLIDTVTVSFANIPITTITEYGKLWSLLMRTRLSETNQTENSLLYGMDEDGFNAIDYHQKYICPLLGVGAFSKIYPLNLIPGSPLLKIQIKFKKGNECLNYPSGSNPVPNFEAYNMKYYFTKLTLANETRRDFEYKIASNNLKYYFDDYKQLMQLMNSNSDNIQLNPTVKRLLAIFAVMQESAFVQNTENRFRMSSFITNKLNKARVYVGSKFYPSDYIMSDNEHDYAEWAVECLNTFGQWSSLNNNIDVNNSALMCERTFSLPYHTVLQDGYLRDLPPSFIIGISTNQDTSDMHRDSGAVVQQGISTEKVNQVILQLYGAQIRSTNNVYTYCKHKSELTIGTGSNGAATIDLKY